MSQTEQGGVCGGNSILYSLLPSPVTPTSTFLARMDCVLGTVPLLSYALLGVCHNMTANTLDRPNCLVLQIQWSQEGEVAVCRWHNQYLPIPTVLQKVIEGKFNRVQTWTQSLDSDSCERRDYSQVADDPGSGCNHCEVIAEPDRLTQNSHDLREGSTLLHCLEFSILLEGKLPLLFLGMWLSTTVLEWHWQGRMATASIQHVCYSSDPNQL